MPFLASSNTAGFTYKFHNGSSAGNYLHPNQPYWGNISEDQARNLVRENIAPCLTKDDENMEAEHTTVVIEVVEGEIVKEIVNEIVKDNLGTQCAISIGAIAVAVSAVLLPFSITIVKMFIKCNNSIK